ncbi:speedy protein 1-B-like [Hyperolius riggenbachi]|uniref:speedy protein 1-B-like n=1 Tax=Hyperolius riggenbachi TaxID=752182 RepID=UPI0035A310B6
MATRPPKTPEGARKRPAPEEAGEGTSSASWSFVVPPKKRWKEWMARSQQPVEEPRISLKPEEWTAFCALVEEDYILQFLAWERCYKISDRYLLAVVLAYFLCAGLKTEEYGKYFFPALFLANQMEEEEPDFRVQIYPWALGSTWQTRRSKLHQRRNELLLKLHFRARVSKETCDQLMEEHPDFWLWQRNRLQHHGWAIRYAKRYLEEVAVFPPGRGFRPCALCHYHYFHLCCRGGPEESTGQAAEDA